MKGHLIFFSGIYDTLDLYTEQFIEVFRKKGYECLNLNVADMSHALSSLASFLEEEPKAAAIGFNGMGFLMELTAGRSFWDEAGIPVLNILMDHPFHFDKHLKKAPESAVVLCMDRRHLSYVRRFYPNIRNVDFLPHAGIELKGPHPEIRRREIPVLYAGTLSRYVAEGLVPDLSAITEYDAFRLAKIVLEELTTHPEKTTEQAIEEYFETEGISFSEEELLRQIVKLRFLDSFAVSFYREQAVRRLVETGVPVTVYGSGWDSCEWADHPNLTLKGRISAREILSVMEQSRIVLNTQTWFKAGTHDRVFNGMLQRAGVVPDGSEYMRDRFTSGKELYMFDLTQIGEMPERVKELLSHPEELQAMADRGYESARECDTWKNRIEDVIEKWIPKQE